MESVISLIHPLLEQQHQNQGFKDAQQADKGVWFCSGGDRGTTLNDAKKDSQQNQDDY